MVTRKTIERLAELNRGSLKHNPKVPEEENPESRNAESKSSVREPALRIRGKKVEYISLEEAVPGQVTKAEDGEFLLIKQRFRDVHHDAQALVKMFSSRIKEISSKNADVTNSGVLETLKTVHPSKILFLDIETCGLSASPLFLIGLAYFTGEDFSILQLFARDYHEERPLLSFFNRLLVQYHLLVTFNGKSFDLPFIISRGYENRVRITDETPHLDLLYEVRRRWAYRLPNCKLQTVERHIFNRKRLGDIPGSEIPQVYKEFVLTGNASRIKGILKHNVLDIVTMIDIVMNLSD